VQSACEEIMQSAPVLGTLSIAEKRYEALVNSTRDILWETDTAGLFTFLSDGVSLMLGFAPSDLIGRSPLGLVTGSDFGRCKAVLDNCLASRTDVRLMECTLVAANGRAVAAEINASPFFNDGHGFAGYRGVTRDISEKKRLQAQQQHLAQIVDSANDAIMAKDIDSRLTSWNKGAERIFGFSAAEAIGRHVSFLAPESLRHESVQLTARMMAGEAVENYRTVRKRKDGALVDILITYSVMRDLNGVVIGTSAIAKDITAIVKLEKDNANQVALLNTEHDLSPDGILVVDGSGAIVSFNRRFLDIWKLPSDLKPNTDDSPVLEVATKFVADPVAFRKRVDYFYAHPEENGFDEFPLVDGRVIQRYTAATRAKDGSYLGRLWFFRDVSEQRWAEASTKRELERQAHSMLATVEALTHTNEMRDPYTTGHQHRVAQLAVALGRKLGMSDNSVEGLRIAGILHDIGKINVPAEILSRPGRLRPVEFELLKGHPAAGYDILKGIEFKWPVAEIVYQHHERLDGSGYPRGLKGDEILLEARILSVADVMEAMVSHRPYRPGLGKEAALAELEAGRGKRFDPAVVDACKSLFADEGAVFEFDQPSSSAPA